MWGFPKNHPLVDVETLKRRPGDDWGSPGSPDPPGRHGHCRDLAGGLALDGVWVAQDLSGTRTRTPLGCLVWGAVEEWDICHPPTSVV